MFILLAAQIAIGTPNGTLDIMFASWTEHLVHLGVFLGAALQPCSER